MSMILSSAQVFAQPQDFGTLFGWWNFNHLSSVTKDGSNNISAISDLSGNGNTFTASGSGNTKFPTYQASGFNGRACAKFFNAVTTGMTAGNVSPFDSSGFTFFIFAQCSANAAENQMFYSKHASSGSFYVAANNAADGANKCHFITINSGATRVDITGTSAGGSFCILTARYDVNAGLMTLFRNGVSIATGSLSGTVNPSTDPLMMGTYNGAGNFHLDGFIGEIISMLGALSDSAINDLIANYMRPYWGYHSA